MRAAAVMTAVLCAVASALAVIGLRALGGHTATPAPVAAQATTSPQQHTPPQLGVVAYNLAQFDENTGMYPSISVHFIQWGAPFPSAIVQQDHGLGITAMIVLEPNHVSLSGIAAGRSNAYLASWASADRELGLPVILSFAPEANGSWYPWGSGHIGAGLYRTMWRRVEDVMFAHGARRITWLWQVNSVWPGSEALKALWPGSAYVNEVGIDGQLSAPSDTFTSVFRRTISEVHAITSAPVMISEVAIARSKSRPGQITGLFAGADHNGLAAVIFFDAHSRWQIDTDPTAVAAFRAAARAYEKGAIR
jgi:hypothetical protein